MRNYELMVILDPDLEERTVQPSLDQYLNLVRQDGGSVESVDVWGRRRLAYEINKKSEGLYAVVNFRSEPAAKDELDRIFRISDDVLRHLIVKQEKKADRFPSRARAAEMERREREFAARAAAAPAAPPAAEPEQEVTDLSASAGDAGVNTNDAEPAAESKPAAESTPPVEEAPAATPTAAAEPEEEANEA